MLWILFYNNLVSYEYYLKLLRVCLVFSIETLPTKQAILLFTNKQNYSLYIVENTETIFRTCQKITKR